MALFAEGGFLSDVVALITAIAGVIAGLVSLFKYLDERRKRKAAEKKLAEMLAQVREVLNSTDGPSEDHEVTQYRKRLDDIIGHLRD